jgi:hypothetical protein
MFVTSSVADPWHYGVDPDLNPRIHICGWWVRIQIRILLFSSLTLLLFEGTLTQF